MANFRLYSTTPASNATVGSFAMQEGMLPGAVNNSVRQLAADLKTTYNELPWYDIGHTPTRTGNTTFTVPVDATSIFTAGRRLKCGDATTIYSTVVSSSFGAGVTTVTVVNDSGNLSASLTTVHYSIEGDTNASAVAEFNRRAYATTAGSSTAYTLTMTPKLVALTNGVTVRAKLHTANGVAPTLAVDGLTAKTIVKAGAASVSANDYAADTVLSLTYDSTLDKWVVHGAAPSAPAGAAYTIKTADYTAVAGDKLLIDCTAAAKTVTMPTSPANTDAPIIIKKLGANLLSIDFGSKVLRLPNGSTASGIHTISGNQPGDFSFQYRGTDAGGTADEWSF